MGIQSEKPIKDRNEDKLKRNRFAINLAQNINNYNYEESITIGLMGSWGSGKSSIINMVKSDIDLSKIELVEFNPWYFSGRKQLISDFFEMLSDSIGTNEGKVNKLGKDLKLYAAALKPLTLIPQIGPIVSILSKISESGGDFLKEYSKSQNEDISKIKERINNQIIDYDKRILVIIDEIDRLENEDIKEIFQLVRALGDFDNMIYLLSFDKEKVIKVFSSGEDYLDKIINVPLYVPELSMKNINDYFIKELGNIFNNNVQIDSKYWGSIYIGVFENKFKNLREVNRFLNVVRFNSDDIMQDLNIVDYLMINFLKMFDEEVYKFIKENRYILVEASSKDKADDLIKIANIESKKDIDFKKLINTIFYDKTVPPIRGIRIKKYCDSYFEYSLADDVFTFNEINNYIKFTKKEELELFLRDMKKENLFNLFNNLNDISEKLNQEQICLFEEVLIEKVSLLERKNKNVFSSTSEQEIAFLCLKNMMIKLDRNYENVVYLSDNLVFRKEYELDSFLKYLLGLKEYFSNEEFKEKLLLKLTMYIYDFEYSQQIHNNFDTLKKIGFDVEQYIKNIISDEQNLILYLQSLIETVDVHYSEIRDDEGEVIDVEEYCEEAIVLEKIKNYIDYNFVKEKVESLSENIKNENKQLIREFYGARPYDEVYAHLIEQQQWEEEHGI
ncbi:KAP family P-loop NTPase fold protein [Clostridium beijerinckii]|uniref:KAP family P-loop NTPase fold protein n=1 Tax=Clostridium beijerinckii TaxID=1520 RepID=UPI000319E84D|nr:P-loop NTPase fold protein [Clostridium beijerinckii]